MITTIDMSSYEIEQDVMEIEYGKEIMCTGWNPAVDLVCEQHREVRAEEPLSTDAKFAILSTPDDFDTAASEIYMRKMYSYHH